jgi:hypothetical protein
MPFDRAGDPAVKKEIGARAIINHMHCERLGKAEIPVLAAVKPVELRRLSAKSSSFGVSVICDTAASWLYLFL